MPNQNEELSLIDQILSPEYTKNVFFPNAQTGEKIEFAQVALIPFPDLDRGFCLLKPVKPMPGVGADEAVAFEIIEKEDGEFLFNMVEDEKTRKMIFKEYLKLVKLQGVK